MARAICTGFYSLNTSLFNVINITNWKEWGVGIRKPTSCNGFAAVICLSVLQVVNGKRCKGKIIFFSMTKAGCWLFEKVIILFFWQAIWSSVLEGNMQLALMFG